MTGRWVRVLPDDDRGVPTGDPLDRIEAWARDTLAVATVPHARNVLALVEVARAARPLFTLAAVTHEGDPWYAEHEGLDAEAILRDAREALARLDGLR